jgi:acyl transferase domain-containing protein
MLAPDGRCKTLDAIADGYVRAEACIVLRLEAADAAGSFPAAAAGGAEDACAVLLKGTFVNQVGLSACMDSVVAMIVGATLLAA